MAFLEINDEGGFYHSQNIETAVIRFGESPANLENLQKVLQGSSKGTDFKVMMGDEI